MTGRHWLAPLLTPRSVAVVGASVRPHSAGHGVLTCVRGNGFPGTTHPVNPRYEEIEGVRCHPSVTALPEPPDLAVLCVANERLEVAFDDAVAGGAGAIEIFASCHLPDDGEPPLVDRLRAKARAAGIPVCGGNSLGYTNFEHPLYVQFDLAPPRPAGGIALFAHSGTLYWELTCSDPRYRYNLAVSQGQEISGTVADYIDYALELPSTRVIALCLETIRDPDGFARALAKARDRRVPVVALNMARTERSARYALSHSGGLAGSDDALTALFERYGARRVETLDELAATATVMAQAGRPGPGDFAAMFDSGGMREMAVDLAAELGLRFAEIGADTAATLAANLDPGLVAENPLDAWGTYDDYEARNIACLQALLDDPATALAMFGFAMGDRSGYPTGFINAAKAVAAGAEKPLFVVSGFSGVLNRATAAELTAAGVPLVDGLQNAMKAARHTLAWRDFKAREAAAPPAPPGAGTITAWRDRLGRGDVLEEAEGLRLLADFGVPAAAAREAADRDAALAAAAAAGYPVALKTAAAQHKSDLDGVRLGLGDEAALAAAYDEMAGRLGPRVTVAPMAGPGVEVAFGMIRDAQFGPLVLVAAGGTLIELLGDRAFALPPFDGAEARRLLDRLRLRPLLDGARGAPAADIDALCEALARFSVLAASLGEALAEVDVNPVIAGPGGCLAVDALVAGRRPDSTPE